MKNRFLHISLICCLFFFRVIAQQDPDLLITSNKSRPTTYNFDPSSPAKASFYSAIFPGLGQLYNKKYWYFKVPVIYASLGTGIYNYSFNNTNYKRVRSAYEASINGKPHEFDGVGSNIFLSDETLISLQRDYKNNRDLSLIITAGIYILQILEANVAAHLAQHNIDDILSIRPSLIHDDQSNVVSFGTALTFKF